ncbi:PfkB family carbohydrate kinase [Tessaracoccus sp. OH4464_COT-324]|uniref:PfkB family carbohydrate kinase n=1 Tax=Tessaracoccus sp. OH4464_COT-324 TaxID=2491059 RepID=UPI001319CFD4|nr:PfkB family carbohydrate kinase [Tessaracoccus sp. OH4464_COT-324]
MDRTRGLFVGLVTLDVIQLVDRLPQPNEKIKGLADELAAGGPATNAAVAFSALGGSATLLTRAGDCPAWALAAADLAGRSVRCVRAPSVAGRGLTAATVLVTRATGERAVVSTHDRSPAGKTQPDFSATIEGLDLAGFGVVELDGHEADLAAAVARRARAAGVPVVLDGGSWKPATSSLLPLTDAAIVSEDFAPTGVAPEAVLDFLVEQGVRHAAITRGHLPIRYVSDGVSGEVRVPAVQAVDTLGAGDFFHGAACHHIARAGLTRESFVAALALGAEVASRSVRSFGTRSWLDA